MIVTSNGGRPKIYTSRNQLSYCNTQSSSIVQFFACAVTSLFAGQRILVPRGRAPFGQHQESRPLARCNTGSSRFTDFPSPCACSQSSLTNLIGCGLNLLCVQSHLKPECRWTGPEVEILGADQKESGLWGRECMATLSDCVCN